MLEASPDPPPIREWSTSGVTAILRLLAAGSAELHRQLSSVGSTDRTQVGRSDRGMPSRLCGGSMRGSPKRHRCPRSAPRRGQPLEHEFMAASPKFERLGALTTRVSQGSLEPRGEVRLAFDGGCRPLVVADGPAAALEGLDGVRHIRSPSRTTSVGDRLLHPLLDLAEIAARTVVAILRFRFLPRGLLRTHTNYHDRYHQHDHERDNT